MLELLHLKGDDGISLVISRQLSASQPTSDDTAGVAARDQSSNDSHTTTGVPQFELQLSAALAAAAAKVAFPEVTAEAAAEEAAAAAAAAAVVVDLQVRILNSEP